MLLVWLAKGANFGFPLSDLPPFRIVPSLSNLHHPGFEPGTIGSNITRRRVLRHFPWYLCKKCPWCGWPKQPTLVSHSLWSPPLRMVPLPVYCFCTIQGLNQKPLDQEVSVNPFEQKGYWEISLVICARDALGVAGQSCQLCFPTLSDLSPFRMFPSLSDLPHSGFEPGTIRSKNQC